VPNRLREYRTRLGLNRAEAAERIVALAAGESGLDAHQMYRHEQGIHKPGRPCRKLYCRLYEATEDELWPRPRTLDGAGDLAVSAQWSHRGTVEASLALTGSGGLVERRAFMYLSGAALTAPAHQWLVQEPGRLTAALGGDRVTPELADRLPSMIAELRRMDDVSGGDLVLGLAEREFSWVTGLLDRATYDEPTARKLYMALAELGQFAGFVAYDAGLHALAQRYWIAALRAAHTADDPALGAYILWSMAHQATEQDQPAEAATLIETALIGLRGRQTPALLAGLYTGQAYAQAFLRDGAACTSAVGKAGCWAEQIRPEDEPPRLYWVNRVDVTARVGRTLLRLGRADQAVRSLADGVQQLDDSMVRDRQLFLADWAEALVRPGPQRDLEEAASRGLQAVALAESLCSSRATERVRDLRQRMKPHAKVPAVREFLERARAVAD